MTTYLSPIFSSGDLTPVEEHTTCKTNQANNTSEQLTTAVVIGVDARRQQNQIEQTLVSKLKLVKEELRGGEEEEEEEEEEQKEEECEKIHNSNLSKEASVSKHKQAVKSNPFMRVNNSEREESSCCIGIEEVVAQSDQNKFLTSTTICNSGAKYVLKQAANNKSLAEQLLENGASVTNNHTCDELDDDDSGDDDDNHHSRFNRRVICRDVTHKKESNNLADNQLHKLFESATCASNKREFSKKLKQFLHSLALMPLLATTTTIMTILLLCLVVLFLTSSLQHASAAHDKRLHQHQEQPDDNNANVDSSLQTHISEPLIMLMNDEGHQEQYLASKQQTETNSEQHAAADVTNKNKQLDNERLTLQRELIGDLLRSQASKQLHASRLNHHDAHRHYLRNERAQHLPPDKRHNRDAIEQDRHNDEVPMGLFDSLGAMIFGASQQQQQEQQQQRRRHLNEDETMTDALPEARVEQQLAADGSSRLFDADAYLDGGGGSNRPAHLRSSELEFDLSPDQSTSGQQLHATPALLHATTGATARLRSQKQQQQRADNKRPPNANTRNTHNQFNINHNIDNTRHTSTTNTFERAFHVPQIQCNNTDEGFERFACPTVDEFDRYRCIEDRLFCDGYFDCPNGEDEDRTSCMYYRLFVSHIDILTNTFLTWMKNTNRQTAANNHIQQQQHHFQQQQQIDATTT